MHERHITRRLAAILAADVAGYSGIMRQDESGTVAALRQIWNETFNPAVAERHGRIVKMMGDGALVEFTSAVDAVECAVAIQRAMDARNAVMPQRFQFRVGINLGDVVVEGEDILGDGVNIAARLEGQAPVGGILVSDAVHVQVEGKVGVTFDDAGALKLKNIDTPVQAWRWAGEAVTDRPSARGFAPPLTSDMPSVAVLPFKVMSAEADQEFFADGLVEDILTTLSKLPGLSVIARNPSFAYKGSAVDVRQVARDLGVRFLLEGSVQKSGDRIRVTAQLIDATTGMHVWADRYDRSVSDIFAMQDEITLNVAIEMRVRLTEGTRARLRYTTTKNLDAWCLFVQGMQHHLGPMTAEAHLEARRCWERALSIDPGSATLNALLAVSHFSNARHGWTGEDRAIAIARAQAYVDRALAIDPDTPDAVRAQSGIHLLRANFADAAEAARRAIQLAPSLPEILVFSGFVLTCCGHAAEAIGAIEKAMVLSPGYPAWYLGVLGNACRLAGRREDALRAFCGYDARVRGFGLADIVMMQEQAGQLDEARETVRQLIAARPSFSVASWVRTQFRNDSEQMATDLASLRRAGLPEG